MADKSSVEKLKAELYSRKEAPVVEPTDRTPLVPHRAEPVRSSWSGMRSVSAEGSEIPPKNDASPAPSEVPTPARQPFFGELSRDAHAKKHSFVFYFLWGSIAFFIIAVGIAAYALLGGGNTISPSNIDLEIIAPSLVDSGKNMTIQYLINNRNAAPLKAADLIIDYPEGTRDPNNTTRALPHDRIIIGDVQSGQQLKQTSSAVFFGAEGTAEEIQVTLEYQIAGSNAIFVKKANILFTIGSAPALLSIVSPTEAISGQPFSMDITVSSNSISPLQNIAIEGRYPFGFAVADTSPAADVGNTLWRLGTLDAGASQTVRLTGALTGADGDQRVFHFLIGSESDPTETSLAVPLLSMSQTLTVRKPFISGQITIDGQTGATIAEPLGKTLQGSIAWQNNLSESVSDLTLTLSLKGAALDPLSVSAIGGFYDSTKNQIVWNSQQNPAFSTVAPGASGIVQFYFATASPSKNALTNPQLALNLTVGAVRQVGNSAPENITSAAQAVINLASSVSLGAQALHFSGPLNNSGPMPPVVGKQTTYTILWTISNSSNTIAGAKAWATLPPYVTFLGAGTVGGEQVAYDEPSRTITWNLNDLKAGAGYGLPLRQAVLQVGLTPSISQVGQEPKLTGDVSFAGTDRFAQAQVTTTAPAPTTHLSTDSGFQPGMDAVIK